jgi:hypothetical protein
MFSNISPSLTYGNHIIKSRDIFLIFEYFCILSKAVFISHLFHLLISFRLFSFKVCIQIDNLLIPKLFQIIKLSFVILFGVDSSVISIFSEKLNFSFNTLKTSDKFFALKTLGVQPHKYKLFKISFLEGDFLISEIRFFI